MRVHCARLSGGHSTPVTNQDSKKDLSNLFRLAGLGVELLGAVIGGCVIGWLIDWQFGTRYGVLIGAIIGIAGGLYNLVKQSLKIIRNGQDRGPEDDLESRR